MTLDTAPQLFILFLFERVFYTDSFESPLTTPTAAMGKLRVAAGLGMQVTVLQALDYSV